MNDSNPVPISKRLVLINSISSVATRLLTVGVFAWVIQYLMERIPDEEMALLWLVLSIAMVLPLLQTILAGGLARFVTEAYARNDSAGVTRIVSSQLPLLLIGSLLMLLVGGSIAWNIDYILTVPPEFLGTMRYMTLLVVGRLAITICLAPFNTGLFATQRFVLKNAIDIGSSLLRIVLMLWLILGVGPRVEWVITAQVVSRLCGEIAATAVSMRLLPSLRFRLSAFDWATSKKVLSFGGWNFVGTTSDLIRRAADAFILYELATPLAVSHFGLGSMFETQLRQMTITASQPLLPALTAMHALDQRARLAAAFLRGGRIALWASMFLAVPLIVFSHDLFQLYLGSEYDTHVEAATVMVILLCAFPLTFPTLMYYQIAYAMGDIRSITARALAVQLGNLALTILLVGTFHMGAIGSATATFVAFAIGHPFIYWPLALKTLQLSWRRFFSESLLPGLYPAVIAAGAGWLAAQVVGDSTAVRAAVGVSVCLLSYPVALFFVLKPSDRADLERIRKVVRI